MDGERIPGDVMREAERVYYYCRMSMDPTHIARAILAERKRCAGIAENFDAWPQEGADIAAAIRRP